MGTGIWVDSAAWTALQEHVRRCYPAEAIGLLAGHADTITLAVPLTNRASRAGAATRVRRDEADAGAAAITARGLALLGVYHSHPEGAAQLSAEDRRSISRPGIEVIAAVGRLGVGLVRAFAVVPGEPEAELTVHVIDEPRLG